MSATPATLAEPGGSASRAPVVMLTQPLKDRLLIDIAKEKATNRTAFSRIERIVAASAALEAATRGRRGATALELAAVGTPGVLPMLERLAIRGGDRPSVRRAMLEALGRIRDDRSLAVLSAVMADAKEEPTTIRTATEAIGRLSPGAAEPEILRALGTASGRSATAILEGMGSCRTQTITQALADALAQSVDTERTVAVMRSLGRVGNAWAWSARDSREHEVEIRNAAANALVAAFVKYDGYPRTVASDALMTVDAPDTERAIREALRVANASQAVALEALAARFSRNPTRSRP